MSPAPGERLLRHVGDRVRFALRHADGSPFPAGWRVLLRTNLGRATAARHEVIAHRGSNQPFAGTSWRDIPMRPDGADWALDLPLTEIGWFRGKPYAVDEHGKQHWPGGSDIGISVLPDAYRTSNTIYCAFIRSFGGARTAATTANPLLDAQLKALDAHGYTAIPPSGKLRDLTAQLPHIVETLGCRILHLLPITPTPTTYARFGRYGSPYAGQDLTQIDPALVEFDRRTTGVDQFRELAYAAHLMGARVFIDIVINHTGWGSRLQETKPDWFRRDADGAFHSPGAWGNTWEDLVELDHAKPELWEELADAFLEWCRRGVDGFRCDAGYMVPSAAWQYITAKVRLEFPDTVFLLEGLGGAWDLTECLLTEGNLQWAYSELFQNYDGAQVSSYLDHVISNAGRLGPLIHYSETHDNDRLAKRGRGWSLLRNRLCALTSISGGFGFTCGVEWLAREKIDVHQNKGLNWGASDHLLAELGDLNRLLLDHPCFFDGAVLERLSLPGAPLYALKRRSADGDDVVLVLANLDLEQAHDFRLSAERDAALGGPRHDLVAGAPVSPSSSDDGVVITVPAGACLCLAAAPRPMGLAGDDYRHQRARAGFAYRALTKVLAIEDIGPADWTRLAAVVDADPAAFLAACQHLPLETARADLLAALDHAIAADGYPAVVDWTLADLTRVVPVPTGHWLLVRDASAFSASLDFHDGSSPRSQEAVPAAGGWIACFPAHDRAADATLTIDHFTDFGRRAVGHARFLGMVPDPSPRRPQDGLALLTNGRGGMARIPVDLGAIHSKYDCVLGINLHPAVPVDRHVLVKRLRVWAIADGFITPLSRDNLATFEAGPPGRWRFVANAGDGRTVEIHLEADMLAERNAVVLRFSRPSGPPTWGHELESDRDVRLSVRLDLEDRGYHGETARSDAADRHFVEHTIPFPTGDGFAFTPSQDRHLRVRAEGTFHREPEWCLGIGHPVEASRGMTASGDAWSPGWFDLPLPRDGAATIVAHAEAEDPSPADVAGMRAARGARVDTALTHAGFDASDTFARQLAAAAQAYLVRRDGGRTVIAGYPWFLDWGRDSLICARGLVALGLGDDVLRLLCVFGRFESAGTLPNCIHGEDASNRDTSDASLWYGVACEDLAAQLGEAVYATDVGGRTIAEVLAAIARGYRNGTPNGIHVDHATGLVWSPPHFTWMDTNYPAATPRTGYPVEIQVLWIRLLRQLVRLGVASDGEPWAELAERAAASFERLYWLADEGFLADLLIAPQGVSAEAAIADHALRSNSLFAVSLGITTGARARSTVHAALRHLVVPGALRSLAPLPIFPPLPVLAGDGRLLNDPSFPYQGRYEGDEDTRRKPAYHNGTAWTWTFPTFCEAMARAWDFSPAAVSAARAYLGSMDRLLGEGCLGHLPEIVDGDAPHLQRGCDAQAWGCTEAARVWKLLAGPGPNPITARVRRGRKRR